MHRNEFDRIITRGLNELGLRAGDVICNRFYNYLCFLLQENSKYNLTTITGEREIISRHFLDSVVPLALCQPRERLTIIDVGSGGGFPGVPLKIMAEEQKIILLEASLKKSLFLNRLKYELGLKQGLDVIQDRAENAARGQLRESCDRVVSRAVAPLKVLVEYTLPFLVRGGIAIYYKGPDYKREKEQAHYAIDILGGMIEKIQQVEVPALKEERYLVIVKKESHTPDKFPRRPGVAKKHPLQAGKF